MDCILQNGLCTHCMSKVQQEVDSRVQKKFGSPGKLKLGMMLPLIMLVGVLGVFQWQNWGEGANMGKSELKTTRSGRVVRRDLETSQAYQNQTI